jgi:hypothetical protein
MQGDLWQLETGEQALEINRTDDALHLSVINPTWPFPAPPIWVKKSKCRRVQNRYNQEYVEDGLF